MSKLSTPVLMSPTTRYHCLKCGEVALSPFPYPLDGRKHEHAQLACTGRVIPIATICDPPEPTVIEASDLAPGMVATIRSEWSGFTCIGQAASMYVDTDGSVGGPTSWLLDGDNNVDDVIRGEAVSMEDFR